MRNLRDFILLVEEQEGFEQEPFVPEVLPEEIQQPDMRAELEELIFKMRAYSEPMNEGAEGGYCLGVEAGLEMAAGMLEGLIREMNTDV